MAAVYLRSEHTSSNGTEWKVDLWDESYVGSVVTVTAQDLTIRWDDVDDAILEPIKASRASWTFYNNSNDVDTFIAAFASGTERRFKMRIYKGGTQYWVGCCLMDVATWENMPKPRAVTITAIDGLGRLEDVQYTNFNVQYTLYEYITECLSKNDLAQFWGATETYIKESCTFYDTLMTTTGTVYSPLKLTRCAGNLFLKQQNKTTEGDDPMEDVGISCADVIRNILQLYCCRIMHVNGVYYIQQINNFETSSYVERTIYKDATVSAHSTISHRQTENTDVNMLGSGIWSYLPPLQRVLVTQWPQPTAAIASTGYQFLTSAHNYGTALTTSIDLGTVRAGTGSGKSMKLIMKFVDLSEHSYGERDIYLEISFTVGSYTLEGLATAPDALTWKSGSYLVKRIIKPWDIAEGIYVMEIITPEILTTGTATIVIDAEFIKHQGSSYSTAALAAPTTTGHNGRIHILPMEVRMLLDKEEISPTIYEVVNSVAVNSVEINYGKLTFNDGGQLTSKSVLEVYNGTTWVQSGVIEAGYSTDVTLSKTLCLETMAMQKTPVLRFDGALVVNEALGTGVADPSMTWYYDTFTFFFNGGELRTVTDEVHGQWVRCLVAKSGLSINEDFSIKKDLLDNLGPKKIKDYVIDHIHRSTLGTILTNASGGTTSLTTTPIVNSHILADDTIYILHPNTFRTVETFVVTADVITSDTSIPVTLKTPAETLYAGYIIVHGEYNIVSADRTRGKVLNAYGADQTLLVKNGDIIVVGEDLMYKSMSGVDRTMSGV